MDSRKMPACPSGRVPPPRAGVDPHEQPSRTGLIWLSTDGEHTSQPPSAASGRWRSPGGVGRSGCTGSCGRSRRRRRHGRPHRPSRCGQHPHGSQRPRLHCRAGHGSLRRRAVRPVALGQLTSWPGTTAPSRASPAHDGVNRSRCPDIRSERLSTEIQRRSEVHHFTGHCRRRRTPVHR